MPVSMPRRAAIIGLRPNVESFLRTRNGEQRQPRTVKQEHGTAQSVDDGKKVEGDYACQQGNGDVSPVTDRLRRNSANHEIASDTSEVSRNERQDQNAEQVEPPPHPSSGSAECEDKGANEIKHQQKRVHRSRRFDATRSRDRL